MATTAVGNLVGKWNKKEGSSGVSRHSIANPTSREHQKSGRVKDDEMDNSQSSISSLGALERSYKTKSTSKPKSKSMFIEDMNNSGSSVKSIGAMYDKSRLKSSKKVKSMSTGSFKDRKAKLTAHRNSNSIEDESETEQEMGEMDLKAGEMDLNDNDEETEGAERGKRRFRTYRRKYGDALDGGSDHQPSRGRSSEEKGDDSDGNGRSGSPKRSSSVSALRRKFGGDGRSDSDRSEGGRGKLKDSSHRSRTPRKSDVQDEEGEMALKDGSKKEKSKSAFGKLGGYRRSQDKSLKEESATARELRDLPKDLKSSSTGQNEQDGSLGDSDASLGSTQSLPTTRRKVRESIFGKHDAAWIGGDKYLEHKGSSGDKVKWKSGGKSLDKDEDGTDKPKFDWGVSLRSSKRYDGLGDLSDAHDDDGSRPMRSNSVGALRRTSGSSRKKRDAREESDGTLSKTIHGTEKPGPRATSKPGSSVNEYKTGKQETAHRKHLTGRISLWEKGPKPEGDDGDREREKGKVSGRGGLDIKSEQIGSSYKRSLAQKEDAKAHKVETSMDFSERANKASPRLMNKKGTSGLVDKVEKLSGETLPPVSPSATPQGSRKSVLDRARNFQHTEKEWKPPTFSQVGIVSPRLLKKKPNVDSGKESPHHTAIPRREGKLVSSRPIYPPLSSPKKEEDSTRVKGEPSPGGGTGKGRVSLVDRIRTFSTNKSAPMPPPQPGVAASRPIKKKEVPPNEAKASGEEASKVAVHETKIPEGDVEPAYIPAKETVKETPPETSVIPDEKAEKTSQTSVEIERSAVATESDVQKTSDSSAETTRDEEKPAGASDEAVQKPSDVLDNVAKDSDNIVDKSSDDRNDARWPVVAADNSLQKPSESPDSLVKDGSGPQEPPAGVVLNNKGPPTKRGLIARKSSGPLNKMGNVTAQQFGNMALFKPPAFSKDDTDVSLIEEALKRNFVFGDLNKKALKVFIAAFEECRFSKGDTIISQGAKGDFFYVIGRGGVKFEVGGVSVGTADVGMSFGELSLLYTCPRTATVVAEGEPTMLFRVDQKTFCFIMQSMTKKLNKDKLGLLEGVSFLKALVESDLQRLAEVMVPAPFLEGDRIITKGDQGDAFYLIKEGEVNVTDISFGDIKYEDVTLGAGDHFGERALVTSEPAAADVIAISSGTLFSIGKATFEKVLGDYCRAILKSQDKFQLEGITYLRDHELQPGDYERLAAFVTDKTLAKADVIFEEGEETEAALYLVREGSVTITTNDLKRSEYIMAGGYFGQEHMVADASGDGLDAVGTLSSNFTATVDSDECVLGVLKLADCRAVFDTTKRVGDSIFEQCQNFLDKRVTVRETIKNKLPLDALNRERILGEGQFAEVWLVTTTEDLGEDASFLGNKFAMKIQNKDDPNRQDCLETIFREISVLEEMDHPFIVDLFHTYEDEEFMYMLTEAVSGGELWSVIHQEDEEGNWHSGLTEDHAKFYGLIIADTVAYMHRKTMVFRDLKPENVLVDQDGYPIIVDFGFAKHCPDKTYTFCGTPNYVSPEIVMNRGHGFGADHWALGILIYEMTTGENPFYVDGMDNMTMFQSIVQEEYYPLPDSKSPELKSLIDGLLEKEPAERLGVLAGGEKDIITHPWFDGLDLVQLRDKAVEAPYIPPQKEDE